MKTIINIDDDQVTARVYQSLLQKGGYTENVANDGKTGLQRFDAIQPHGVLLDLMLPGMPGVDVLEGIRARTAATGAAGVPVIVFTNAPVSELLNQATMAGATAIFSKSDMNGFRLCEAFRTAFEQQAQPAK